MYSFFLLSVSSKTDSWTGFMFWFQVSFLPSLLSSLCLFLLSSLPSLSCIKLLLPFFVPTCRHVFLNCHLFMKYISLTHPTPKQNKKLCKVQKDQLSATSQSFYSRKHFYSKKHGCSVTSQCLLSAVMPVREEKSSRDFLSSSSLGMPKILFNNSSYTPASLLQQ